jgi:hypothetical protein
MAVVMGQILKLLSSLHNLLRRVALSKHYGRRSDTPACLP